MSRKVQFFAVIHSNGNGSSQVQLFDDFKKAEKRFAEIQGDPEFDADCDSVELTERVQVMKE